MREIGVVAIMLSMPWATSASAVCARASLAQEYREADVVARVRVLSEQNFQSDTPTEAQVRRWGDYNPVVVYHLRADEIFKGEPGPEIRFFEGRDSGAFYVDPGEDYLVFLHYIRPYPGRPTEARGAMYVRYACSQSMRWGEVRHDDLAEIRRRAVHRP